MDHRIRELQRRAEIGDLEAAAELERLLGRVGAQASRYRTPREALPPLPPADDPPLLGQARLERGRSWWDTDPGHRGRRRNRSREKARSSRQTRRALRQALDDLE